MNATGLAWLVESGDDLFDQIGRFLADHGLGPDPAHYSFAHQILTDPEGPVAQAVGRLSDGGVRLSQEAIEQLGGTVVGGTPVRPRLAATGEAGAAAADGADRLVAETQAQVEGFASMMREMHDETRGFGRDLQQSAAAIRQRPDIAGIDEIARITGAMIARIHAAEIRLARATDETEVLREKLAEAQIAARRDPLTLLPNRRAFDEAFVGRDPLAGPWCLAVCDIDRFKRINDDHGHTVGDRVLRVVGRTITEACDGHLVVRHGGEEFAVLVAGLDLTRATTLVDAARETVASKRFRNRDTDRVLGQVSMSVGITMVGTGETGEEALDRADRLLYAAKAAGRNQVCAG
jgi:diguanylate cyclase